MGIQPQLLSLVREREIETQLGQVNMNCEACKFRLAFKDQAIDHSHGHGHHHNHDNGHGHSHDQEWVDPYVEPAAYHQRIWQAP